MCVCVCVFYMYNMKVSKPLMESGASQKNTPFKAFFPIKSSRPYD